MQNDIERIHGLLPENEQLRIYRFYLTAVHRNSVMGTRFEPYVLSSPERSAAMEAEFDDITHQLDELTAEVAFRSLDADKTAARLFAADFLWAVTWWVHARRDVTSFVFDPMEDPFVLLLLGRGADRTERVASDIYQQAAAAELEYRKHVTIAADVVREPRRTSPRKMAPTAGSSLRRPSGSDDCHL